MLIDFSVNNFLSFNDTQTLSMEAGMFRNNSCRIKKSGKYKLLKFMSIYGANASGKTNIITALDFFQTIVVNSFETGSYPLYCKIKDSNKEKPSLFEIKILLECKVFVYGFKAILSKSMFNEEWLYEELHNGNRRSVFHRDIPNRKVELGDYISSKALRERLEIYADDIRSDSTVLFLKIMNQNKSSLYNKSSKLDVFRDIFLWIKYNLDINSPEVPITNYSFMNDAEGIDKITQKLSDFSTGVVKFDIIPITMEKVSSSIPNEMIKEIQQRLLDQSKTNPELQNNMKPTVLIRVSQNREMFIIELNDQGQFEFKTMVFKHQNTDSLFSLSDESDGTIRLLDILEVLLTANEEKVYVIDEINRRFHPLLTRKFVEEFLKLANERNTQLIVTTHESQLMDLQLLRRDEINFINKDENGFSTIYSLDKFDVRFDKKVVTEYLKGRYGAIPTFESLNQ